MNTNSFEKIINESWNNKNEINSKSDKKIINLEKKLLKLQMKQLNYQIGEKSEQHKKRITNGLLINGLKKQFC